ncbi:MAG: DUF3098 domain-containing protein [Rikenellaceae bacterium]
MTKKNYILMGVSVLLAVIGFALMSGGASASHTEFNEEMFSFRRITLSVIFILVGFSLMGYAIMKKFNNK